MRRFVVFVMAVLAAAACDPADSWTRELNGGFDEDDLHGMIVLGNKLEDPYTVENMTKALAEVYPTKADRVVVSATHLYVRFLPESDGEYDMLDGMGVQMLDHPVDYEILKEGDYYHDPSVEEGHITWQYAVVEKDFHFPEEIRHEVLDECYIVDNAGMTKSDGIDWDEVERASYRLTGNGDMVLESKGKGESVSGSPEGKIQIIDDFFGDEPEGVRGVRVSCNSFVKFANAYTDENGNYAMTRNFSSKVRYRLVFKNSKGFAIGVNLLLVPASVSSLGKDSPKGKDVLITKSSEGKLFCRSVVNNAAYDYFESCEEDGGRIKLPPSNLRIWIFQHLGISSAVMLQQGALVDNSKLADVLGEYTSLLKMFLPDINLGLRKVKDYSTMYAETLHELSHASHFMQVGTSYWNKYLDFVVTSFITSGFVTYGVGTEKNHGYCQIGEMWAYFNEMELVRRRYDDEYLNGTNFWFSPQIFLYMSDRGLGRSKIFNALTSDITDPETLQKKLVSLYPENKSLINQAFARYQ